MGIVLQHKLPEVTSRVVLNNICRVTRLLWLPAYLWVLGTWVWCSNTSYLRLPEVTSRVVGNTMNTIQLPGYSGYHGASVGPRDMGMVLQHKLPEVA